ncbi:MAG: methyl-accepting chemotaxis protein [Alicyclobacillus mali]|uniref:methyl-accepting chemotaxis protein n=1 Tax=Alicyclobacillus mali (ex Roth et al. 2021) TaxID=1123961 RepID=UPI00082E0132|nr:methyl-accepting chemotaxis protein [Alicyclobacillus mali (ex Roth et al. 2021)]MCL6487691.1 methyl-accepting chemotaxis protein [Alicyclobacillus mali (ex Roth et al. 2021)]
METTSEALHTGSQGGSQAEKAVRVSLRVKMIVVVIVSLAVSVPIADAINAAIRRAVPDSHYGIYVNSAVSVIVSAALLLVAIQILVIRPLGRLVRAVQDVAAGNLAARVAVETQDEMGLLARELNAATAAMQEVIRELARTSGDLAAASQELAASAEETGKAAEQIAFTIQDVSSGVRRQDERIVRSTDVFQLLSRGMNDMSARFQGASEATSQAREAAREGGAHVAQASAQMASVEGAFEHLAQAVRGFASRSQEVGAIVEVMTRIAKQTHLLALNAAIEAARAGEAGRGFSVVASEIRKLAEQSADSSKQIASLVDAIRADMENAAARMASSREQVEAGRASFEAVDASFARIRQAVERVDGELQGVLTFVNRLGRASAQLREGVDEIAQVSAQTSAGMETVAATTEEQLASMQEMTASAAALAQMAESLQRMVANFRLEA